ncbi:MCE family protein [Mycolicibacterium chitae]|uniref:MCE family protein n=1 Tax=Mycolicibacterium chitae TaxID=1792 RepID=UPI001F474A75|nr:MCE family protein [Mycolicibacterium chitae]
MLASVLTAGIAVVGLQAAQRANRTHYTAYFANSNGIYPGDDVMILGVTVGKIETIEPQPERAKISFWVNDDHLVPEDVRAVILSPQLITARAIQLTPAYTGGPTLAAGEVIPESRTAVPVEWDDFREQLERLTESLQPTGPGETSPLGAFINTAADNLRGQGATIREAIIELSQTFSALGDHSDDLFSSVKNLSILVTALHDSADLMRQLNGNLAAVSGVLVDDGSELGEAFRDIDLATADLGDFLAENRESIGVTGDKLASVSQTLVESIDEVKQALHVMPTTFANLLNIYQPAQSGLTGVMAINNFAHPIQFLCGAIQAASRLGAEQAAKLCVQYLAPIVKNRQYNFPPLGVNPFVGTTARPNELTYSEDWLRPDYIPPTPADAPTPAAAPPAPPVGGALPAEAAASTNPNDGLAGMMTPPGGGS